MAYGRGDCPVASRQDWLAWPADEISNVAIETALFIRQVFQVALRQTEDFMNSLVAQMGGRVSVDAY